MSAGKLQVAKKATQYAGPLREWDGACLVAPETATRGVHTDFVHGLAHGAPVLGIGEGVQLPLHPRPTQMQRDGAGMWAIMSQVQQPALALASRMQFGLGRNQSQSLA